MMRTVSVLSLVLGFVVWSHSHPGLEQSKARTLRKAVFDANKQTTLPLDAATTCNDSQSTKEIEHQPNKPITEPEPDGIRAESDGLSAKHGTRLKPRQIHANRDEIWSQAGPDDSAKEIRIFWVGREKIQVGPGGSRMVRREVRVESNGDQNGRRRGIQVEPDKIQAEPDDVNSEPTVRHQQESCTQEPLPRNQPVAPIWNPSGRTIPGSLTVPHSAFLPAQYDIHLKPDQILRERSGEMRVQAEPNINMIERRKVRMEPKKIQAEPGKVYLEPEAGQHLEPRAQQPQPGTYWQHGHYPTTTVQLTIPHPKVIVDAVGRPIRRVLDGASQDAVNGIYNVSRHKPVVHGRLHAGNLGLLGHQGWGWFRKRVLGKKKPQKPYYPSKYGLAPPNPTPTWFNTHQNGPHYPPTGTTHVPVTKPHLSPPPGYTRVK